MPFMYAMSDMHGDMEAYERALSIVNLDDASNLLVLCGDYLPPSEDVTMCRAIMRLQEEHPDQVVALMGNHELAYMEDRAHVASVDDPVLAWIRRLPFWYETEAQIFVHAGVDEEAEDLWRYGSEDADFCQKTPWSTGRFLKDVVAGHIGTHTISGDPAFHDVYWDGASHYYLDGSVHVSHNVPVLKYDADRRRYTAYGYDASGVPVEYELDYGAD